MASREEVANVFPTMVERFDPKKAEGINAAIQFDLTGDNGGMYWLRIADSTAQTGEGTVENPKMTLKASADDFYSMMTGALNPMQAFMTGKIKIQGDTSLALKLMPLIS
ncbi:MAG TPA: SCP2 sterol-binding domain-containing protein [Oceanobacillus sp.]|nr:SCP2 sterol-binding domain-containing protein [Oceanobacillus sp.]